MTTYTIDTVTAGTELDLAGGSARLLKDGEPIGRLIDHGDDSELDVADITPDELALLEAHALASFESREAFLEDLIRRTVDGESTD